VGYRRFVEVRARELGLKGWARNEPDGRVQVYATGAPAKLDLLAAALYQGPRWSDVRGVEQHEAAIQKLDSFEIR
jgi:acylphosphatase